uniref:Flavoprotein pyridine nucleotide cytochrome reductase-like FAD-binding domain-containing protein n=1 Tax=Phaeomonas parva TaxID=124430 RepID=A0A7S1XNN4_9STRA|mmetsp:Transcript_19547/g.59140  ORF Transcript_19547/g.59140 Transcript_19547/m.59140 type:complete len:415 (+) Transcript_19547:104-1348(+)
MRPAAALTLCLCLAPALAFQRPLAARPAKGKLFGVPRKPLLGKAAVGAALATLATAKPALAGEALKVSLGQSVLPNGAAAGAAGVGVMLGDGVSAGVSAAKVALALLLKVALPLGASAALGLALYSGLLGDAATSAKSAGQGFGATASRAISNVREGIADFIEGIFAGEESMVDPLEWFACTLESVNPAGDSEGWLKYRFKLKDKAASLPLDIGQGVTICGLDDDDRVVRMDMPLLSPRKARGYFEVVVRSDSDEPLLQVLSTLAPGDEIAAKCGPQRLDYTAEYQPVTSVVALVNADGILPALGVAQELLPSKEGSVETFNIVWVNDKEADFVMYDEVERLFYKFPKQMDVSCVIDEDIVSGIDSNAAVLDSVPRWEPGAMAIVAGDPGFCSSARSFLEAVAEYPNDTICNVA